MLQFSLRWPDIWELAPLTRSDNHQLVTLSASREERSEQVPRQFHFTHADLRLSQCIPDRFVRDLAERAQQAQLVRSLDLSRLIDERICREPLNARKITLQRGKIFGREKFHLNPDLAAIELEFLQRICEFIHRIIGKLAIDSEIVNARVGFDRSSFH